MSSRIKGMQVALAWIESQTGERAVRTRLLRGGLTSEVRAVRLAGGETLVLRRHTRWGREGAVHVEREAATLTELARTDLPVPRLVAAKPCGDVPMILMTRVPGRVHLVPRDPEDWHVQIARTLVSLHEAFAGRPPGAGPRKHPRRIEVPKWTARPDLWKRAIAILSKPPDDYTPQFCHGDFQHFNILWTRARLTGLVDWSSAWWGHPSADAAHCRLNLAVLFSADHAERFREIYEAESGHPVDPWWDLRGLSHYGQDWKEFIPIQVNGLVPVDAAGMDDRIEDLMERILQRA